MSFVRPLVFLAVSGICVLAGCKTEVVNQPPTQSPQQPTVIENQQQPPVNVNVPNQNPPPVENNIKVDH